MARDVMGEAWTMKLCYKLRTGKPYSTVITYIIVHWLTCSCGASYIGQTQSNLINRIEEHRTSLSSSVCRHLEANPDHRVDFHNPSWLAVINIDGGCRFLNLHWFKNANQSWMQASHPCPWAFSTKSWRTILFSQSEGPSLKLCRNNDQHSFWHN